MSIRALTLAGALALASLLPAAAAESSAAHGFYVPNMITASYGNPLIATNPDEVRRQGGFSRPAAVRWKPTAPQAIASMRMFYIPTVVGAAFRDPLIATSPDEVRHQGGFSVPAAVRWLPTAPSSVATTATPLEVGAL